MMTTGYTSQFAGAPTRQDNVRVLLGDGNWHRTSEINGITVGGTEGVRRLRELRAQGCNIQKRRVAGSTQFEYRLISVVSQ